ncbi:hypothetical protein B0H16DRAFT_1481246 [Mycena metata]|uniref:Uncharacterized protein n=1 Tax=Mycena metata TaxID=1033252 RepID=A0AAD7GZF5_9AGAR|nr:hypothetical protein B0H16DRAFT_1481246 [Mycena metata]
MQKKSGSQPIHERAWTMSFRVRTNDLLEDLSPTRNAERERRSQIAAAQNFQRTEIPSIYKRKEVPVRCKRTNDVLKGLRPICNAGAGQCAPNPPSPRHSARPQTSNSQRWRGRLTEMMGRHRRPAVVEGGTRCPRYTGTSHSLQAPMYQVVEYDRACEIYASEEEGEERMGVDAGEALVQRLNRTSTTSRKRGCAKATSRTRREEKQR